MIAVRLLGTPYSRVVISGASDKEVHVTKRPDRYQAGQCQQDNVSRTGGIPNGILDGEPDEAVGVEDELIPGAVLVSDYGMKTLHHTRWVSKRYVLPRKMCTMPS